MTDETRKDAIYDRMRSANPVSSSELRSAIGDDALDRALNRAIALGESSPDRTAAEEGPSDKRSGRIFFGRRRARISLGAGLACVAVGAAVVLIAGGSVSGRGEPEYAAAAIEVAEANPRLLVTEPGWTVTRAFQFEPPEGEMTFSDGSHHLDVHWRPAELYESYRRDRADVSSSVSSRLLGRAATTVHYGRGEYATMLAPQGPVFVEIRGRLESKQAYESLLRSLRPVDIDTWLAALPASIVRPGDRASTVESMLREAPLPPGFDIAALSGESSFLDGKQLAMKVGSAVACGWFDSWVAAKRAGDEAAAVEAAKVMLAARDWPIMQRMASYQMGSSWVNHMMRYSRQIEYGSLKLGPSAFGVEGGVYYGYGPSYALHLGCDSAYKRRLTPAAYRWHVQHP